MANEKPAFNVYTVEDRGEGEDPFWLKIGAAWPHKDGKGYNVTLSALPPDNRLVLRVPTDNDDEPEIAAKAAPKGRKARRS